MDNDKQATKAFSSSLVPRGIKDQVHDYWGYIMAKFWMSFVTSEEAWSSLIPVVITCNPILNVYCDVISGHTHKQLSCIVPPPLGICGIYASKTVSTPLSMGIVNVSFHSAGTGKYATPTRHSTQTFYGKLRTFSTVKSSFLLNQNQQYTPALFGKILQESLQEKKGC